MVFSCHIHIKAKASSTIWNSSESNFFPSFVPFVWLHLGRCFCLEAEKFYYKVAHWMPVQNNKCCILHSECCSIKSDVRAYDLIFVMCVSLTKRRLMLIDVKNAHKKQLSNNNWRLNWMRILFPHSAADWNVRENITVCKRCWWACALLSFSSVCDWILNGQVAVRMCDHSV